MNDSLGRILIFLLSFLIIACAENESNVKKLIQINEDIGEIQKPYFVTIESFDQINEFTTKTVKSIETKKIESKDYFLVKYDQLGRKIWTKNFELNGDYNSISMTLDSFGNIYLASYLIIERDLIYSSNLFNMFLTKYNSDGIVIWKKNLGKSSSNSGMGIATDSFNNVYITGFNDQSLNSVSSYNNEVSFLKKFNSKGIQQWGKKLKILESEKVIDVMVDQSNQIHITSFPNHDFDGILKSENNDLKHVTYNTDGFLL